MSAGSRLGRYDLLARLATGGMGEIFLARLGGAAGFEKLCVIKRILPHLADDARFRAMLIGEARIAANLSHPNICHIYELEETDHQLYMAMEYLRGITLLQLLGSTFERGAQLELGLVAGVVQQACDGLHHAHELCDRDGGLVGLVHRDITPSNLFVTESGVVKIVDFGIAKVRDAGQTDDGAVKGKYAYMAPEQLRGETIDRRVDVFSLGIVIYEMIACRRLYQRETDYLTFRAVMAPPALALGEHRPDAPAALEPVLRRALALDPAERFATVRQLAAAVLDALGVRPWGQAEIAEQVRATFGDELRRNDAEVSRVIRRSERESLRAIPVLGPVTGRPAAEPGEPDYLSIETQVGDEPPRRARFEQSDVRSEVFGQAVSIAGPAPLTEPAAQPPVPRWARLAPLAAIVGGAAVVLVVGLAVIGGRPSHRRAAAAAAATVPGGAPQAGSDRAPRTGHPRAQPSDPYGAAIQRRERELDQCARAHGEQLPGTATAVIVVAGDGHARQIDLRPAATGASPLGSCIRGVLERVVFPTAPEDKQLALGLAVLR